MLTTTTSTRKSSGCCPGAHAAADAKEQRDDSSGQKHPSIVKQLREHPQLRLWEGGAIDFVIGGARIVSESKSMRQQASAGSCNCQ